MHEKQYFHKNAQRKHIFLIFRNWRKYHISCKSKIKENIVFSIIFDVFGNKSLGQDFDDKNWLNDKIQMRDCINNYRIALDLVCVSFYSIEDSYKQFWMDKRNLRWLHVNSNSCI